MTALIIPFPRAADAEHLHDRYILLGRAYARAPSPALAAEVEGVYRAFYIAATGGTAGLDMALADLRQKMARTMARATA